MLLIGSEWGSYAAPVSGSGAQAAAPEAAEEAIERLAQQGARQAVSRSFASLDEALEFQTREAIRSLPAKLYHYTDEETAVKILTSQLGRDENTILYLTPSGGLSPLQAQIQLALPPGRSAAVVFEVPTSALDPSRIVAIRRVVGNVYGRAGGGVEVLYRGTVPKDVIQRVR